MNQIRSTEDLREFINNNKEQITFDGQQLQIHDTNRSKRLKDNLIEIFMSADNANLTIDVDGYNPRTVDTTEQFLQEFEDEIEEKQSKNDFKLVDYNQLSLETIIKLSANVLQLKTVGFAGFDYRSNYWSVTVK